MANAAKKKASQAKKQAASLYQPVLIVLNIIYVVIRVATHGIIGKYDLLNTCICWGLTYFAYLGICADYADQAGWSKGSSGAALSGGSSLDLLVFTLVIQFGSLFSNKVWYGLLAIPVAFGYKLYTTFRGAIGGLFGGAQDAAVQETESYKGDEKKQKRSEKRKQK